MVVDSWTSVVEALAEGRVNGADPGPFERYETHGSVVLVSANVAYKLKKPVTFDFLDYGTVERRREMSQVEVALNRRLAPGTYLEAAPVTATAAGYSLGGPGEPVEWVVVMRPLAADEMLDHRVDSRRATSGDMERVGQALARFHLCADAADPAFAAPDELRRRLADRVRTVEQLSADTLGAARLDAVASFAHAWLDRHGGRLIARAEAGWVRDGHGDLRLEHVALRNGSVEVIDCVEFDPALRGADVLSDLAFLVMELELAGRGDLAAALTGAWAAAGGPLEQDALCLFAALRALVRVEVAVHRAAQLDAGYRRDVVTDMAKAHLALAQRLAWRAHGPTAVLIGGLSGSGKTVVSTRLAERWGLERVASDETRKRLVGVGREELAPRHAYHDYVTEVVYENLGRSAAEALANGRSVVVDATFRRERDRHRFLRALGDEAGDRRVSIALKADYDVLRGRVGERSERGGSDADVAVLEDQLAGCRPGDGHGAAEVDASGSVEDTLIAIEGAVLRRLA